jgi:hypothetical protein
MAPGMGIKAPVPRTRTGCLTCRKRKVKCDEAKPICGRCQRLQRECTWSDDLLVIPHRRQHLQTGASASTAARASPPAALQLTTVMGQNFSIEFPNVDRTTISYLHHFITFCCRFLAYSNDNEGNPFQAELVPLANSSPALLHSIAALAAGHMCRTQQQHSIDAANHSLHAAKHYGLAIGELNRTISDPVIAQADSTLGSCLLLCVFEITNSKNSQWLAHLKGARELIRNRGGPSKTDYLTRFFSLLDVSGSLSSGIGPLIKGNYWLEDGPNSNQNPSQKAKLLRWPYYDSGNVMVNHFHELMIYMAKLSNLSAESMSESGMQNPDLIAKKAFKIHDELLAWWSTCPPALRDQSNDWRRQHRPQKLTIPQTLEEEAFSSTKSCMQACIIYLNHILDPLGQEPQKEEVINATSDILEIANETPTGYGLEMGLYWGLFMAGVAIFDNIVDEDLIRQKLKADRSVSIYVCHEVTSSKLILKLIRLTNF